MRRTGLLLALTVLTSPLFGADEWSGVERVVAVGDVHGDYGQFITLLRQAALIDDGEDRIGGRAHLVQTGDVPDRGPDSRKVMDLLKKLEKQARKAKGYVHALVGNHEAVNIYGDLRYVHEGEYEAFKTPRSRELLEAAYEAHVENVKQALPEEGLPDFSGEYRDKWIREAAAGMG